MNTASNSRKRARESQDSEAELEVILNAVKSEKADRRQLMNTQLELEKLRSAWSADVREAAEEERDRNEARIKEVTDALKERDNELMEIKAVLDTEILAQKLLNRSNSPQTAERIPTTIAPSDASHSATSEVIALRSELRAMEVRAEEAQAAANKTIEGFQAQAQESTQAACNLTVQLRQAKLIANEAKAAQKAVQKEALKSTAELSDAKRQLENLTRELKLVRTKMNQANANASTLGTEMDLLKIRIASGKVSVFGDKSFDQLQIVKSELETANSVEEILNRELQDMKAKCTEVEKSERQTRNDLNKTIRQLRKELESTKTLLEAPVPPVQDVYEEPDLTGEPVLSPSPEPLPQPTPHPAPQSRTDFIFTTTPMPTPAPSVFMQYPALEQTIKSLEAQLRVEKVAAAQVKKEIAHWKAQTHQFERLLYEESRKLVELQTGLSRGTVVGTSPIAVTTDEICKRFGYDEKTLRKLWLRNNCVDRYDCFRPPREVLVAISTPSDPSTRVAAVLTRWRDPLMRCSMAVWFAHRWAFANVIGLAVAYPHMADNLEAVKLAEQLCLKENKSHGVEKNM